jgi:septum site-determining protein MinC
LLIAVDSTGTYDTFLQLLETELAQKQAFLQGSQVALHVGRRPLGKRELLEIQKMFLAHQLELWAVLTEEASTRAAARNLDLATRLSGSPTDLDGNALQTVETSAATTPAEPPAGLILKETLRSGRSVYHEGHVVVIGDVNPGAEIMAGGDVIVWGRLRGLVHAGAQGDTTAVICALELNPTQLRIAGQIAIAPAERQPKPEPEQAAVRDGQIVAERWQH